MRKRTCSRSGNPRHTGTQTSTHSASAKCNLTQTDNMNLQLRSTEERLHRARVPLVSNSHGYDRWLHNRELEHLLIFPQPRDGVSTIGIKPFQVLQFAVRLVV